jgi:hypothetical protein
VTSGAVRLLLADRPPGHCGPSALGTTDCLSLVWTSFGGIKLGYGLLMRCS